jgi:hypothetical protein
MRTARGSFLRSPSSGEGSTPAERLHLAAGLGDPGLARPAHGVARAPSSPLRLAHRPARGAPGAPHRDREGPRDARPQHRLALGPPAASGLWDRASARPLVRAGALRHLAAASAWPPLAVGRRPPRRPPRPPASWGAARADQPAAARVCWPALRPGAGGVGRRSRAGELVAHAAHTPGGVSQRPWLVAREGGGVGPTAWGAAGHGGRGGRRGLPSAEAPSPRPGQGRSRPPRGLWPGAGPSWKDRCGASAQPSRAPWASHIFPRPPGSQSAGEARPPNVWDVESRRGSASWRRRDGGVAPQGASRGPPADHKPGDPAGRVDAEPSGGPLPNTLGARADALGAASGSGGGKHPGSGDTNCREQAVGLAVLASVLGRRGCHHAMVPGQPWRIFPLQPARR